MQKTVQIFYLCFLVLLSVTAQDFHLSKQSVVKNGLINQEIQPEISIRNLTNKPLRLKWEVEEKKMPNAWRFAVCDKQCQGSAKQYNFFTLAPRAVLKDFKVNFRPYGHSGTAKAELKISSDNTNKTVQFQATAHPITPIRTNKLTTSTVPVVYPNPVIAAFQLKMNNTKLSKIEIYNVLGKKIDSFKVVEEDQKFDISDYPRGMYMVRMFDAQGQVLYTKRISKHNP